MMAIACPSCSDSMQIEEHEPNTEWECPSCGAAFLVHRIDAAGLDVEVTQPGRQESPAATKPIGPSHDPNIKDEVYVHALECLMKGQRPRDVRKGLLDAGYSAKQADQILQTALKYQRQGQGPVTPVATDGVNPGVRNMMIGGIVFLIGIIITIGSMTMATGSGAGGGKYVLAWGAIVFGGIQFLRGLYQSMNS